MIFLYNLISLFLSLLIIPYIWIRFRGIERKQRLGKLKFSFDKCIWIHASSVGEVNAVKPLINELLRRYPSHHFVISTMTRTGHKLASGISAKLIAFFVPVDLPLPLKRVFNCLNPELIILVETELWPGMLGKARKAGIDVVLVNGRLSDKSYPCYRKLKIFWKPFWKAVSAINAQSEKDAERFRSLGFKHIENTDNLKFNLQLPKFESKKLRNEFGYTDEDFILVWGSSRPGEEKLLREVILSLRNVIVKLKVILAPRHITRINEIREIFSDLEHSIFSDSKSGEKILIIDEMGVLPMFYAIANLAIVGGSFYNFGGHNPLEPAYYGIPTIIGKYHHSCRKSVQILESAEAILISDRKRIQDDILRLYHDDKSRIEMGKKAAKTIRDNVHSLEKNLKNLEKFLN